MGASGSRTDARPSRGLGLVELVPIVPRALAVRVIPSVEPALAAEWGLPSWARSAGLITCTSDDALFVALDEGTKAAPVEVAYARSFYAGSSYPSGPLSGEAIGVYAARDPDEIRVALDACVATLEREAWFYAADREQKLAFFPHVVRATGSYLSKLAGVAEGAPIAYLIAPPLESMVALDAAMKAAPVTLQKWFGPPSETNFGGGYLAGALDDCEAAARAFAAAVVEVAKAPHGAGDARGAGDALGARPMGPAPSGKYRVLATGERLREKPEHLTHLVDDESLVEKTHPRIVLRGKIDLLQQAVLDAQCVADADGARGLVGELGEALELLRTFVGCEVTGRPLPSWTLGGLGATEIRWASHHTHELFGIPFMYPSVRQGPVVAKLSLARAIAREAEVALHAAFPTQDRGAEPALPGRGAGGSEPSQGSDRYDLKLFLNRVSSAFYVMTTKYVAGRYGGHDQKGPVRGWKPPAKESAK